MNIILTWNPKPDITLYELAQCIRYAAQMVRPIPAEVEKLSPGCGRHFEAVYDKSDIEACRWVHENISSDWSSPVAPDVAAVSQVDLFNDRCRQLTGEFNDLLRTAPSTARKGEATRVHHPGIPDWLHKDEKVVQEVERRFTEQGWQVTHAHADYEFWEFSKTA